MTTTESHPRESLWRGALLLRTVGVSVLEFTTAFEYLAVATVMPDVAHHLHGIALYAVAFAAPLAVSVVGYVLAGPWIDRRGPRSALTCGIAVFSAGLVIAGVAPTMLVLVLGRAVQGLGAGLLGVALYVVVAQAYPQALHARAFAVLSAAWVLPAIVGPVLAATVADVLGWRWVFLAVPVLAVVAWLLVRGAPLHRDDASREPTPAPGGRLVRAAATAAGVLVITLAGQRDVPAWPALLGIGLVVTAGAGAGLLPRGSWTGGRGLPSVVATRGLVNAGFACAEAYVPLILTEGRGLSLAAAGWVLTAAALTWSGGAWAAAAWRVLADEHRRARLGVATLTLGIAVFALTAAGGTTVWVPAAAWAVAGAGIGVTFSTTSVLTLSTAPDGEQGAASSAAQLNASLLQAMGLALGSALFTGYAHTAPVRGATILTAAAAAVSAVALVTAARMRPVR